MTSLELRVKLTALRLIAEGKTPNRRRVYQCINRLVTNTPDRVGSQPIARAIAGLKQRGEWPGTAPTSPPG